MYGAPVDLSFKNISSLTDTWIEEPNRGLRPLKRNSEMKYLSCSLRLSNNNITELHDLQKTISHFLAEPARLTWLDLSFNKITHIDHVLYELRELRVLYLHGNSIFILSEVDRLGVLPHLHSITLHGNVIETNKAYRNRVISVLPRLKTMDFSAVTQQERVLAKIWHRSSKYFLHKLLFSNEELNSKIHNRWNNALRNRMMNATQLQARLREVRGTQVSRQTIRNRLHQRGLHARRPARVPDHTKPNIPNFL